MNKIAIVGIGCVVPGARNKDEFWRKILANATMTTGIELNNRSDYDDFSILSNDNGGKILQRGFADDWDHLDNTNLSKTEWESLDPVFRRTLIVVQQALNDCPSMEGKLEKVGMIMGNLGCITTGSKIQASNIYHKAISPEMSKLLGSHIQFAESQELSHPLNSIPDSGPVNITAKAVGLGGPCFSIDAACASSLYVLKLAELYLASGAVDAMIAGGVSEVDEYAGANLFNFFGVMPSSGVSAPLNKNSSGLTLATGGGAFVLKRYEDAVEAGDKIHAVVEAIGWSNDGGKKYILAPDSVGQQQAYRDAHGKNQSPLDYIECHATGTQAGDAEEVESIAAHFGKATPLIGAVKPNIGHTLTASGMAAMTKVIMAMKHNTIPATIGLSDPISSKDRTITSTVIVTQNTPWPQTTRAKRAAINAFGFGGSNGHAIFHEHTEETFKDFRQNPQRQESKAKNIGFIGLGVHLGSIDNIKDFSKVVFSDIKLGLLPSPLDQ